MFKVIENENKFYVKEQDADGSSIATLPVVFHTEDQAKAIADRLEAGDITVAQVNAGDFSRSEEEIAASVGPVMDGNHPSNGPSDKEQAEKQGDLIAKGALGPKDQQEDLGTYAGEVKSTETVENGSQGATTDGDSQGGAPVNQPKEYKVLAEAGISLEDGSVHAENDIVDLHPESEETKELIATMAIEEVVAPVASANPKQYKVVNGFGGHNAGDILTPGTDWNPTLAMVNTLVTEGDIEEVTA